MDNWQRYQPGLDVSGSSSDSEIGAGREKVADERLERTTTGATQYDLEKSRTGPDIQKTATGQAQVGADDEIPKIELKTFLACLAISFLWTGSQIPLYMLLVCIDYTLADIGGADIQIWYVLGPLLALAATAPVAGSVSDIFGRRWAVLIGGIALIIGLILIGTTQTPAQNIVSFPFTGIGAALLEINALAAVNEIAPNKLRGFYTSMLTWTIIPFAPLGIYAFNVSVHSTWRWNVWIPLIWVVIGQVMTFIFYRPPVRLYHGHTESMREKLFRIDWLGFFLSLAGTTLFLFGLGTGGYSSPWKSAQTIVPLILGFLLLVVLGYWEKFARNPLYPPGMFKNTQVFVLTLVITAVAGANFFTILILWPKYVITVFRFGPTHAGLLIFAQTGGVLFGAGFFSYTITRFQGAIRGQMVLSCALMMAGFGALVAVDQNRPTLAGFMVTMGAVGVGGIIIPASVITQLCTPDEYLGTVTALTFVARVLGGAIGFTIYYYILNYDATKLFADTTNPQSLKLITTLFGAGFNNIPQITKILNEFAISDTKSLLATPGFSQALLDRVGVLAQPIWAQAFQNVWLVTLAFSGLGLICSLFLGDVKKYMTNHRAVII
ncbi:protein of unknown function [Taphrina deformans PYCC 5710]|uniref:Major facilitator superfamily (MFS) profile domain-containing protein n=1 Tax=Taphrina deformans (strain PYCC 5710 / ATCC 11124 / CBS 356.35 / IMI 108563 / JCM 9778 / NBRC 8474) TaxID=1097556 RepID=R4XH82_TAPDE|nr:protein of unknown function [Taphrina deformans PYCC 5710]|eukprot:CCG83888.1 protein of unknown function [Taphrina deformans PYCC 5710]